MRELFITPQFRKDTRKIPKHILEEANLFLLRLRNNPLDKNFNIKKLKKFNPVVWRIRIGSYRVVYSFNKNFIVCLRFKHRKDIYRDL